MKGGSLTAASRTAALLVGVASLGYPVAVYGQTTASTPPGANTSASPAAEAALSSSEEQVPDIIVTAQRRSERLQKTALSIAVISDVALANAGVTSPLSLTSALPGVQIGNSGPAPSVYLRGVGAYAATATNSPAIPFYVDGIYVARSASVVAEFFDVERVEALRGPQGTLYGRNASGGALNVLTRKPELGRSAAMIQLEAANYDAVTADVAFNLPLGDTLAVRASGQIVRKGGYTSEDLSDEIHQSARIKLLWQPAADTSVLLNASYGHVGGAGLSYVLLNRNVPGWYPWLDSTSPQAQQLIVASGPPGPPGLVRPAVPQEIRQNLNFWNVSAEIDQDLGFATLTVLPAYRHASMAFVTGLSYAYANGSGFGVFPDRPETSEQTSLEVRLANASDRLKWVVGLYGYNEDQQQVFENNGGLISHLGQQFKLGTRSYAVFGEATFTIVDGVRLTAGARETSDRRTIDGSSYFVNPTFGGPNGVPCLVIAPAAPACLAEAFTGRKTFTSFSWKGGIEADLNPNVLAYATVSRGFKAGGFNSLSGDVPGKASLFRPEELTSYDAGLKSSFFDRRLQVNIAGFYWDYRDHQEPTVQTTSSGTVNLVYFNAGKSRIYGGNLDIIARPWSGGTINASVEYANSKYLDFSYIQAAAFTKTGCPTQFTGTFDPTYGPKVRVDCSGFQLARAPTWSGSAGFTQQVSFGTGKLTAAADVVFASARWLAVDFVPLERAKAYALVNASLTYEPGDGDLSVTAFVRNINNGRSYTSALASPLSGAVVGSLAPPRTYGLRLNAQF